MDKFIITGARALQGVVKVSGSKNTVLPILAASLLTPAEVTLKNVPLLQDTQTMLQVLECLGKKIIWNEEHTITLKGEITNFEAPYELVRKMRASILVLGPLLAASGKACISLPGGCALGARPINLHLEGLAKLGARMTLKKGYIKSQRKKFKPADIFLNYPSVGATENLVMASVFTPGRTTLQNTAREPEIVFLIEFLNKLGAKIKIEGARIEITGVRELSGGEYTIGGDRIEAATFLIAAAITQGEIVVEGCSGELLQVVLEKLSEAGCEIKLGKDRIKLTLSTRPQPLMIKTLPYPGFPTDVQPLITSFLALAKGTSVISETVFTHRFLHAQELTRMGAAIRVEGENIIITGRKELSGAEVIASDIRAGAALILAALAAKGSSVIHRVYHIDRGYENIEKKLARLGAVIRREE
jgi:UDP-N-acetylglucosamine 1-carboxyvinyltransferase